MSVAVISAAMRMPGGCARLRRGKGRKKQANNHYFFHNDYFEKMKSLPEAPE